RPLLREPLAALLGSDAHWVFDRGRLTGQQPEHGQYLTVVSSGVRELMDVRGRELVERIASQLTDRFGPAELEWSRVRRESNATMIAEHLFLLHFLGLRDAGTDQQLANELLARRRADGTWSIWFDGPPDLSVTVEVYAALKLAGVDPGGQTREYIQRAGGVPRTR